MFNNFIKNTVFSSCKISAEIKPRQILSAGVDIILFCFAHCPEEKIIADIFRACEEETEVAED